MEDYGAEDLQKLWQFQDNLEDHAKVLLNHGLELGALAFALELTKLMLIKGQEPDASLLEQAKINAVATGKRELEKRMGRARGTNSK